MGSRPAFYGRFRAWRTRPSPGSAASIETPSSGSFEIDYPEGNSITYTFFPDSIPIVVTANQVPVGDYLMTVTAEGPNGTPVHVREATISVVPIQPPTADFTAEETEVCKDGPVEFLDQSVNATSWLWTFEGGDPATSTGSVGGTTVVATQDRAFEVIQPQIGLMPDLIAAL